MSQLDLFAEPPPPSPLQWGSSDEAPVYDELVRRNFPGFEYILYDFRLGQTWHRVLETTTEKHGYGLAVAGYQEPNAECDPARMTLSGSWHFPIGTTPNQIAAAISAGAPPTWTRERGPVNTSPTDVFCNVDGRQVWVSGAVVIDGVRHRVTEGFIACDSAKNRHSWNTTEEVSVCPECFPMVTTYLGPHTPDEVPESNRQPMSELSPLHQWHITEHPDGPHARKWRAGYRMVYPPPGVNYEPGKWVKP